MESFHRSQSTSHLLLTTCSTLLMMSKSSLMGREIKWKRGIGLLGLTLLQASSTSSILTETSGTKTLMEPDGGMMTLLEKPATTGREITSNTVKLTAERRSSVWMMMELNGTSISMGTSGTSMEMSSTFMMGTRKIPFMLIVKEMNMAGEEIKNRGILLKTAMDGTLTLIAIMRHGSIMTIEIMSGDGIAMETPGTSEIMEKNTMIIIMMESNISSLLKPRSGMYGTLKNMNGT